LKKAEIYLHTKFRRDITIHSWDKTTSGFGKRKAAILELYFPFRFWPMCHKVMSFWIYLPNIVVKGRSVAELRRHIDFLIWRP